MKNYLVTEKPSVCQEFLRNGLIQETDSVDFTGPVFDTAEESLPFFRHPDGKWYNAGEETCFTEVNLPGVPHGRFIGVDYSRNDSLAVSRQPDGAENDARYIYFAACGKHRVPDLPDLIAAAHHADYVGAKTPNCSVQFYDVEHRAVSGSPVNLMAMLAQYAYLFDEVPVVNPLRKLCIQAKMSFREFSDHFGIRYRTVQNWAEGVNRMPEWALPLFQLKLMTDGKI